MKKHGTVRGSILRAAKGAVSELRRHKMPATSHAIAKLGAATYAIGGKVEGWTGDFERALHSKALKASSSSTGHRKKKRRKKAGKKRRKKSRKKARRKGGRKKRR